MIKDAQCKCRKKSDVSNWGMRGIKTSKIETVWLVKIGLILSRDSTLFEI